jgi:basic membrane lipoprotein Med (substrate-binding protein (PBP1-ABC) superfamily)
MLLYLLAGITAAYSPTAGLVGAMVGGAISFIREFLENFDTRGVATWNGLLIGIVLGGGVVNIANFWFSI